MKRMVRRVVTFFLVLSFSICGLPQNVFAYENVAEPSNEAISLEKMEMEVNGETRDADVTKYEDGSFLISVKIPGVVHIDKELGNEDSQRSMAPGYVELYIRILPNLERIETGLFVATPLKLVKSGTVSNWSITGDVRPNHFEKLVKQTNMIPGSTITFEVNGYYLTIRESGTVTVSTGGGTFSGLDGSGSFEPVRGTVKISEVMV